jgi:hypothetical protein
LRSFAMISLLLAHGMKITCSILKDNLIFVYRCCVIWISLEIMTSNSLNELPFANLNDNSFQTYIY